MAKTQVKIFIKQYVVEVTQPSSGLVVAVLCRRWLELTPRGGVRRGGGWQSRDKNP